MTTENNNQEAIVSKRDIFMVDPRLVKVQRGWNAREDFGDLEVLTASIVENGVLNPIHVKRDGDDLVLIDGERRIRACLAAIKAGHDIKSVPAFVRRATISEVEAMVVQLTANEGKQFTEVEQGHAFRRLIGWGLKVEDIAKRMGRCDGWVRERLELVDACPALAEAVRQKKVPFKAALKIVRKSKGSVEAQQATTKKEVDDRAAKKVAPKQKRPALVANFETVLMMLQAQAGLLSSGKVPAGNATATYLDKQESTLKVIAAAVDVQLTAIKKLRASPPAAPTAPTAMTKPVKVARPTNVAMNKTLAD